MFLGIGRNTVTLPTSKVIPINFPLSNIIFRKCMYRTIWTSVQWNVLNKTIQFPHKIQNQKNLQQHASILHKAFLETTTLKTMLTSAVKRRELIDFTIFFSESAYTCNLLLYSIIRNKHKHKHY